MKKENLTERDLKVLELYRTGGQLSGFEGVHNDLCKYGYLDGDLELTKKGRDFIKGERDRLVYDIEVKRFAIQTSHEIHVNESEKYISITVEVCKSLGEDYSMSWEELQGIKDFYYKDIDFIEVYPKNEDIVNKANVRHLLHIKGWSCPHLGDLEMDSKELFSGKV